MSSRSSSPVSDTASRAGTVTPAPAYRFAFGKTRETRGPGSVFSDANDSRVDFSANGQSLSAADVYGSLDLGDTGDYTFAPGWTSSLHGFNGTNDLLMAGATNFLTLSVLSLRLNVANPAISTVLNNPKRASAPLKSARAPLPPTVSPDLPRVRRKDFDTYVNTITPIWDQYARHATIQRAAISTSGAFEFPSSLPSASKGKTREIPPLSVVPPIFFDSMFDLRNPRTFASVTEQDATSSESPTSLSLSQNTLNPEDISLNQVLQEKLSHYMDVVEQHLTQEIQSRSTSFFAALSNLQDLQTEGADCLDRIGALRKRLEDVDLRIARKGLQTIRLQKRLANMGTVEQSFAAVKEIKDMLSLCERLIAEANWDEALALIAILQDIAASQSPNPKNEVRPAILANGEPVSLNGVGSPPTRNSSLSPLSHHPSQSPSTRTFPRPASPTPSIHRPKSPLPHSSSFPSQLHLARLSSLSALGNLGNHIDVFGSRISSSLRTSLLDSLRTDLVASFESSPTSKATPAIANRSSSEGQLRVRLAPLWQGLLRTGGVSETLTAYQDLVLGTVKTSIRKVCFFFHYCIRSFDRRDDREMF